MNLEGSPRPTSKAPSSISIDENSMELRDVDQDESMLDELEINKYLVFKKQEEDGPDIRGGHPDALLIHATKANKHGTHQVAQYLKHRSLGYCMNFIFLSINNPCVAYVFVIPDRCAIGSNLLNKCLW